MPTRSTWLLAALPLAAVAVGVFADGGYDPGPRVAFGLTALAAAAITAAVTRTLPMQPVAVVLLALAALGALSAVWTLGPVDRTLRWGLVTAGFAAVMIASGAAARRPGGQAAIATGLAAMATAAAAIGLTAAVAHWFPYAERIAGVWRPGGPFEYPPALAALQVSALPVLLAGMMARGRAAAAAAAVGMALAGGVLALAASRLGLALALVVAGLALAWPQLANATRTQVAAALALATVAGAALAAAPEPLTLVAVAVLAAPAWLAARAITPPRPELSRTGARAVVAVLAAAAVIGSVAFGAAPNRGGGPGAGFLHGRTDTWSAALQTFADRPLSGTGAGAFLAGSARHQDGQTIRFAHNLPLELAAELGLIGLLLALAFYATTARALWRSRTAPRTLWLLGPAAAVLPVTALVDWQWHLAGAGAVWALALGAIAGAVPRTQKFLQSTHKTRAGYREAAWRQRIPRRTT
jgi:hypothetical protein